MRNYFMKTHRDLKRKLGDGSAFEGVKFHENPQGFETYNMYQ